MFGTRKFQLLMMVSILSKLTVRADYFKSKEAAQPAASILALCDGSSIASTQSAARFPLEELQSFVAGLHGEYLVSPVSTTKTAPYLKQLPLPEKILLDPQGVIPMGGFPTPGFQHALTCIGVARMVHSSILNILWLTR